MLQSNELRIGNAVYTNITHRQITTTSNLAVVIYEIKLLKCAVSYVNNGTISCNETNLYYTNLIPIQLTPCILKKCGFVANEYNDEFEYNLLLLDCEYTDGCFNVVFNECTLPLDLKYLHQLQNLYFALIGKELTVKL